MFPAPEDPDDPWRSIFDDLRDWFSGPRVNMVTAGTSLLLLALGTFFSVGHTTRSTYFCSDLIDSKSWILFLQVIGLVLDAATAALLWRLLTWSRTTYARIHTLGTVLALSSLSVGLVWLCNLALSGDRHGFGLGFGSLYAFDIIIDSVAFATLMISAALWVCQTSPVIPASAITMLVGVGSSLSDVLSWGDWLHLERSNILMPLWTISGSTVLFLYFQDIRALFFVRRILIVVLLMAATMSATMYTSVNRRETFAKGHPISDLMYKSQVAHDHWLRNVHVSQSLAVAVTTYEERHSGRAAPPNFAEWFNYAKETVVVDDFLQIDKDLAAFWTLKPQVLRDRVKAMADVPDVLTVTIQNGEVTHSSVNDDQKHQDLEDLVTMIGKFSKHLPDMTLPINLEPSPRIIPSWETAHSHQRADLSAVVDLLTKRSVLGMENATGVPLKMRGGSSGLEPTREPVTARDYRQMQIDACSPSSPARANPQWSFAEFCSTCAVRHSQGPLLANREKAMETCAQSDLRYLHGLYLSDPPVPPIQELFPLFSLAKTDSFSDILFPLPRMMSGGDADIKWKFSRRYDTLFWRGSIGQPSMNDQYLHGNHKLRLLHLLQDSAADNDVVLILPIDGYKDMYGYERISAAEASGIAPFSAGIGDYSKCSGQRCDLIQQAFGTSKEASQEPLEYRYVLLLDEDGGPSTELVRTLRSGSVPFISTIFQTWYTERIRPWLHFVPIDPRYQGLHTTYLYFTGTENRVKIKGRETQMKGRLDKAEWIAQEGQKWADKALGQKDMEVYLFRLLLEWGRLLDDQRDKIGFRKTEKGGFDNAGFSQPGEDEQKRANEGNMAWS